MKKKQKPDVKITCRYCKLYCKVVPKNEDGERIKVCNIGLKQVDLKTEACSKFEKANLFLCDKNGMRLDFNVCLARKNKNSLKCRDCRQFRIIEKITTPVQEDSWI